MKSNKNEQNKNMTGIEIKILLQSKFNLKQNSIEYKSNENKNENKYKY